jgi:hypothetical protein
LIAINLHARRDIFDLAQKKLLGNLKVAILLGLGNTSALKLKVRKTNWHWPDKKLDAMLWYKFVGLVT